MIDIKQFRDLVVRPTLQYIDMYSPEAEELLIGTAVQESRLTYLTQLDGDDDPYDNAVGVFQMEVKTHNDIWNNYIAYRQDLSKQLIAIAGARSLVHESGISNVSVDPRELIHNLAYATALCRIHYRRQPGKLPAANDVQGMGEYWKQHYNSERGKGTVEEFVDHYFQYVKHGGK